MIGARAVSSLAVPPRPADTDPAGTGAGSEADDAFGRAVLDWVAGGGECEVYERDDGFLDVGAGPELYLAPIAGWPAAERAAMRYVRGRTLDVGCGAGRVALHLQGRGVDVVGLDASAGAVRGARRRGVRRVLRATVAELGDGVGAFDTVVLFGNNFGIHGSAAATRRALRRWAQVMAPGARLLAESTNPSGGAAPLVDAAQRARNRRRGAPVGQVTARVRYHELRSAWFDWLFVSPAELRRLVRGTGWTVRTVLDEGREAPYVAVLELPDVPGLGDARQIRSSAPPSKSGSMPRRRSSATRAASPTDSRPSAWASAASNVDSSSRRSLEVFRNSCSLSST